MRCGAQRIMPTLDSFLSSLPALCAISAGRRQRRQGQQEGQEGQRGRRWQTRGKMPPSRELSTHPERQTVGP